MLQELAYLHHKPESKGLLRVNQSDFKVFELLPFYLAVKASTYLFILEKPVQTLFLLPEN